jgi:RND family efflux transporter MFP subunit
MRHTKPAYAIAGLLAVASGVVLAAQPLDVVKVEYRNVDTTYSTEAVVEAVRQSTISAQVMGRIVDLRADVGESVKAGQVVARIDEREAAQVVASTEAQVAQARANLQNARLNLDRARQLLESRFVSQAAVDRAEADFKAAQAQLQAAEASAGQAAVSKGYTTVVAPISGVVSARHVQIGEMATPGRPLLTTFSPGDMRVVAEVPQSMIQEISTQSRVTVEIPSINRWFKVRSMTVIPTADPRTHSSRVRLDLEDGDRDIYPGVYARAHFAVGRAQKLVIPAQCVVRRSEVTAVYVVDEQGATSLRQVRLGEATGEGLVEVLAGLAPGERIAMEPVKAGMVVSAAKPQGQ